MKTYFRGSTKNSPAIVKSNSFLQLVNLIVSHIFIQISLKKNLRLLNI